MDANLKSSGPLTPQQPNWEERKGRVWWAGAGRRGRGRTDGLAKAAGRQRGGRGQDPGVRCVTLAKSLGFSEPRWPL